MGKTIKEIPVDPYESVRRTIPKSGWPIRHAKEYIKPKERVKVKKEVVEGIKEYAGIV